MISEAPVTILNILIAHKEDWKHGLESSGAIGEVEGVVRLGKA